MRKMKKIVATVALCVIGFSMVGCSKDLEITKEPETIITEVQERFADAKSMDATMVMEFAMTSGEDTIEMKTNMDMVAFTDPYKAKINMRMDMGALGSQEIASYLIQEGESYALYSSYNGTWDKTQLNQEDFDQAKTDYLNKLSLTMYLSNADSFKMIGNEEVNGKDALKLEGILTGESLETVLNESGILDQLELGSMGVSLFSNVSDMPITLWIEEDSMMPIQISIDMAQVMQEMMDAIMSTVSTITEDTENIDKVEIPKSNITITYNKIGSVEDFELPDEIRNLN